MDDFSLAAILIAVFLVFLYIILIHSVLKISRALEKLNRIVDSGVPTFALKEERCPKCKSENPIGWRFCGKCGKESPYGYTCTDCGQMATEDQKFCTYCGKKFEGKE